MKMIEKRIRLIAVLTALAIALGLGASAARAQGIEKLNRFLQSADSADPATKMFLQGRDDIQQEKWERAAERFNDFIKDYPDNGKIDAALYWMAYAFKKQDKAQRADELLEKLIDAYPASSWVNDAKAMMAELSATLGRQDMLFLTDRSGRSFGGSDEKGNDEDEIKIVAIQSLFQANPDRAREAVLEMLKSGSKASPKLKREAVNI
ncbi:MAG: tetratricopeptide repeat protein, partial [Blastocatellia bacterium]